MLSLWNPFVPVKSQSDGRISTKSYFDRLFEDTFEHAFQDLYQIPKGWGIESQKQEDGSLAISVDVPGIQESDLSIEIVDNMLTIKGERKTAASKYSVNKSLTIPKGYDTDNIVAELSNGVLNIKLAGQMPPAKEIKKIPITTSNK